jgi:hypothetical protein
VKHRNWRTKKRKKAALLLALVRMIGVREGVSMARPTSDESVDDAVLKNFV